MSFNIISEFLPRIENVVDSIPTIRIGINIGNESMGNKAPLTFAREIIAPIIVDELAIPMLPEKITKTNNKTEPTSIVSKNIWNITAEEKLINNEKATLYINLPKKTERGVVSNFKRRVVPFSSSLMNALDIPVIDAKNITAQSIPV